MGLHRTKFANVRIRIPARIDQRKLKESDALSRNWQATDYDVQGNPRTAIDPKGQVTTATCAYGHLLMTRSAQGVPEGLAVVALTSAESGTPP